MRLDEATCRERVAAARSAYLATTGADLAPHIVPVTFALVSGQIVIGIDQKPKTTYALRRLRNIEENPRVALLCDAYDEDWTQLWWVRVDGTASVIDADEQALEALVARYEQYNDDPPRGPVIVITPRRWSGWAYA
ncbi:MAG: TIGR03668 family PPOX class F420-dependent oxidoreductase [Nocardioides sp.]|nr:TIGR03668 family PPOX class F420-dependent oxidoreductase [Nocardioides sp.]